MAYEKSSVMLSLLGAIQRVICSKYLNNRWGAHSGVLGGEEGGRSKEGAHSPTTLLTLLTAAGAMGPAQMISAQSIRGAEVCAPVNVFEALAAPEPANQHLPRVFMFDGVQQLVANRNGADIGGRRGDATT